ncbi:MAG: helix-hairpin-helix domain-containing protein [Acidimicrobiia bacterium]|nr:helix-hairpin-helix domain-containing protein [Acidimicrobiia bacterium]
MNTVVQLVRSAPRASAGVFAIVVLAAAVGFVVFHRAPPAPAIQLPRAESAPAGSTPTTTGELVVDVAGAVGRPGIVRLGGPGRVADAIAAAGGAAPDADLNQVNLAAKVNDGDRVYVPRRGESPPLVSNTGGTGAVAPTGPVDLNRATVEQLDALPGVGPATAKAIVDYRTRHGSLRSVDDLLSVPGIGPAKLANLKPLVRV